MRLEAIVLGYVLGTGIGISPWFPFLVWGLDTQDNVAVADGHGSQGQQKEAEEDEEVVGRLAIEP